MTTAGKAAKKKSAMTQTTRQPGASAYTTLKIDEEEGSFTSQGSSVGGNINVAGGRGPETDVVDGTSGTALDPEHDNGENGHDAEGDHDDPDGDALPGLDSEAEQEEAEGELGDGHADHGKRLADHLPLDGLGHLWQLERRGRLAISVSSG